MRRVRIYQPGNYAAGEQMLLSEAASQHVGVVLRMQVGDSITVFDGHNQECVAHVVAVRKQAITVQLEPPYTCSRESPAKLHLVAGIIKNDGMEWLIQKAVELGVTRVVPVLTQHGAIKHDARALEKKHRQWQAIAVSACEQSGRNTLPTIEAPGPLSNYLATCDTPTRWILDPTATRSFRTLPPPLPTVSLLVGPEGGFHPEEIHAAQTAEFQACTLGPRVLRAETASIAALSILQALIGDLQ